MRPDTGGGKERRHAPSVTHVPVIEAGKPGGKGKKEERSFTFPPIRGGEERGKHRLSIFHGPDDAEGRPVLCRGKEEKRKGRPRSLAEQLQKKERLPAHPNQVIKARIRKETTESVHLPGGEGHLGYDGQLHHRPNHPKGAA